MNSSLVYINVMKNVISIDPDLLIDKLKKASLSKLSYFVSKYHLDNINMINELNLFSLSHTDILSILNEISCESTKKPTIYKEKNIVKKKKLRIIHEPEIETKTKPKKLKIIPDILPLSNFKNDYDYFIHICQTLNYPYYKYKSSCLWIGPALIIDKDQFNDKKIHSIKNKFTIKLNTDILDSTTIAIYPQKSFDHTCVSYPYNYNCKESDNIELKEWYYNEYIYYVDDTNKVYSSDTMEYIGYRHYSNTWNIVLET